MANIIDLMLINDGPRNASVKWTAQLDTGDLILTPFITPNQLAAMDLSTGKLATSLLLKSIQYDVSDGRNVNLIREATVNRLLVSVGGRGEFHEQDGQLIFNPTAGETGRILVTTEGFTAGNLTTITLIINFVKTDKPLT